jgi:hypothetical protein
MDFPPGASTIEEVYELVRRYLDGDSDDLRAYEALDWLYSHARANLGLPDPFGNSRAQRGPLQTNQ